MNVLTRIDELREEGKLECLNIKGTEFWVPKAALPDDDMLAVIAYFLLCTKDLVDIVYDDLKQGKGISREFGAFKFRVHVGSMIFDHREIPRAYVAVRVSVAFDDCDICGFVAHYKAAEWPEYLTEFTLRVAGHSNGSSSENIRRNFQLTARTGKLYKSIQYDAAPVILALRKRNVDLADDQLFHTIGAFLHEPARVRVRKGKTAP